MPNSRSLRASSATGRPRASRTRCDLPSPRGSTPHASASISISTRPRPDEASSPGVRRCGRSSLVSATSTRSRRRPRVAADLGDQQASPSVCTRTFVSISETISTAESTWSSSAQSCSSPAAAAGPRRPAPARPGRRSASCARGTACRRRSAFRRRSARSSGEQQQRDVVLAPVGQRPRGVVRRAGRARPGPGRRRAPPGPRARALRRSLPRGSARSRRQPVSRSWPPVSISPSVQSSIVSPGSSTSRVVG